MKNKAQSLFTWIKAHRVWSAVILIVFLIVVAKVFGANSGGDVDTITLEPQEFLRTVEVAGKVTPSNDVELGFETTGRISAVYKEEGDRAYAGQTLAALSSGNESADILKAQAELDAEIARLNELKSGANTPGTALESVKRELYEAMTDA